MKEFVQCGCPCSLPTLGAVFLFNSRLHSLLLIFLHKEHTKVIGEGLGQAYQQKVQSKVIDFHKRKSNLILERGFPVL